MLRAIQGRALNHHMDLVYMAQRLLGPGLADTAGDSGNPRTRARAPCPAQRLERAGAR